MKFPLRRSSKAAGRGAQPQDDKAEAGRVDDGKPGKKGKKLKKGASIHLEYRKQLQEEIERIDADHQPQSGLKSPRQESHHDDIRAFALAVFEAAGRPRDRGSDAGGLVRENKQTWTMRNLEELTIAELTQLAKDHLGKPCQLPQPFHKSRVGIFSVGEAAPHALPFADFFFPQDKYDMNHSDGRLCAFDLNPALFQSGTMGHHANPSAKLAEFAKVLFGSSGGFACLHASPTHAVTLPAHARTKANIPTNAAYYSYCFPPELDEATRAKVDAIGLDQGDPLVLWMLQGAFIYFSHSYDLVAVNALSFDDRVASPTNLFLGAECELPRLARGQLEELGRLTQAHGTLARLHVSKYSWIIPSEMLGNHIFTQSGGFCFVDSATGKGTFRPVVPPVLEYARWEPLEYKAPVHIPEFTSALQVDGAEIKVNKWVSGKASDLTFAENKLAALGIEKLLGITDAALITIRNKGVQAMEEEFAALPDGDEDRSNLRYILKEKAFEQTMMGNDGQETVRDAGHEGMTLEDFCKHPNALVAELRPEEVAALRIYTSNTFRRINMPLRERAQLPEAEWTSKPHPLAATTFFISNALKKLRAVNMGQSKFESRALWRGLKDVAVNNMFLEAGGAELACMSTTTNLKIVARYARSHSPLMFKIKVDTPMELGADISWLSLFPQENEVLYPPLTYLKPFRDQPIKDMQDGRVVTIKPSFPS